MVIVIEVVLDAAVALIHLAAALHRTLVGRLGRTQVVAERLHVKSPAPSRQDRLTSVRMTTRFLLQCTNPDLIAQHSI